MGSSKARRVAGGRPKWVERSVLEEEGGAHCEEVTCSIQAVVKGVVIGDWVSNPGDWRGIRPECEADGRNKRESSVGTVCL